MTRIGLVTTEQLRQIQISGMAPEAAVERLLSEAKARYPEAGAVIMLQLPANGGFEILAVGWTPASPTAVEIRDQRG